MGKTARLFMNGHSQAVRLPKEFRFEGHEVGIRREGERVVLTPLGNRWADMFERLDRLLPSDDYMAERGQPPEQERPGLDELFP